MSYAFNAGYVKDRVIEWVREQAQSSCIAIEIDGKLNSAVSAAISCRAIGEDKVYGIIIINNSDDDISKYELCNKLGIKYYKIDIRPVISAFAIEYYKSTTDFSIDKPARDYLEKQSKDLAINLWAKNNNALVCGINDLSDRMYGIENKGNKMYDFSILGGLTSIEVSKLGENLPEIPKCTLDKSAYNKTQWDDIHRYIRNLEMDINIWRQIHSIDVENIQKKNVKVFEI